MLKYILAWRFVKFIFNDAKAYDFSKGKAFFSVNEDVALKMKRYVPFATATI